MLNSVTIFGQSIKSFRKNQTLDVLYYRSFHFFPLILLDIGMQKKKLPYFFSCRFFDVHPNSQDLVLNVV